MELTKFQNCLIQKCINNAIKQDKKNFVKEFSNNAIEELTKVIEKLEIEERGGIKQCIN